MASLLEGLRALGSGRVLDDVLALVLDSAIEVTGAERGFIMLASNEGVLEFKLGRAAGRVTLSGRTFETSRKIPEGVFTTGKLTIVEDLRDIDMAARHMGTVALGIRHVLCAPLRLVRYVESAEEHGEDKVIGVLYLDSRERGALRSQAARACTRNAQHRSGRGHRERPAVPRSGRAREARSGVEGRRRHSAVAAAAASNRSGAFFSTAGTSLPCRSVGGDFFDFVDLADDQFGFILGDVAGKGAPAALLAAAVLGMFGAEASYQSRCASVVSRLNRGLFRRGIEGRFLTAFYAILVSGRLPSLFECRP